MPDKRIVFFGTSELSVAALEALVSAGFVVPAVVSQPDRTRGRDRKHPEPTPVKARAEALGIRVLQPEKSKDEIFLAELEAIGADAFAVFAFGQILPRRLIDMPRLGCFNAHASLLPALRGAAPINWAIIRGEPVSGMTVQRVVFKLDAGPTAWAKTVPVAARETARSLTQKLLPLAGEGLVAVLSDVFAGRAAFAEQDESQATFAPILKKEDGEIDWTRPAVEIDRLVRGLDPWPGATTTLAGQLIRLWDAPPLDEAGGIPGEVKRIGPEGIVIACGTGALALRELQREGKKRLDWRAFLNGCRLRAGDRFEGPAA
ncbi:MAG: methionyl-tRNA formyltransferase [Myxococcales bacterium]|nr:MAG: methionyl-tRNA formyltransferase [Myxococcales bacterium]